MYLPGGGSAEGVGKETWKINSAKLKEAGSDHTLHGAVVVPQEQPWGQEVPHSLLPALLLHPGCSGALTEPPSPCCEVPEWALCPA